MKRSVDVVDRLDGMRRRELGARVVLSAVKRRLPYFTSESGKPNECTAYVAAVML